MKCFLDVDGLLADFVKGASLLHGRDEKTAVHYNFYEVDWGMDAKDFWGPMGREFWANLPPTEEGPEVIRMCEEVFGRKNIRLFSSPCTNDGCMDGKLDWIKKHHPNYSRRFLFGTDKHDCASPFHLLIDDSEENYRDFISEGGLTEGGDAILVPKPWNCLAGVDVIEHLRKELLHYR